MESECETNTMKLNISKRTKRVPNHVTYKCKANKITKAKGSRKRIKMEGVAGYEPQQTKARPNPIKYPL
jgi:hypothetical protein